MNVNPPQTTETVVVHARISQKLYGYLRRKAAAGENSISTVLKRLVIDDMGKAVRDGK